MSHDWSTFALWGVFLGVLTAITTIFGTDVFTYTLLGTSALFILAIGGFLFVSAKRRPPEASGVTVKPDLSYSALLLGVGLTATALGTEWGFWLVLTGAGVCAVAIGGLVRELTAQREAEGRFSRDG